MPGTATLVAAPQQLELFPVKRHVARMVNTDQRLVVVFMQIPGREDHALVIPTDTLPARYEQAVMEILKSPEGQAEETFANVLNRRLMPDSGKPVLQALHDGRMLLPVPVANVMMMPMPNMPFPLSSILDGMGRKVPAAPNAGPDMAVEKYNQIMVNQKIEGVENRRAVAQNLLIEAEMLEAEGRRKRAHAYSVAPEMAPKEPVPPAPISTPISTPMSAPMSTPMSVPLPDMAAMAAVATMISDGPKKRGAPRKKPA